MFLFFSSHYINWFCFLNMSLFLTVPFLQVTPLLAIRMEHMNERVLLFWDAPLIGWLQSEWTIFHTVKKTTMIITFGYFSVFAPSSVLIHNIFFYSWLNRFLQNSDKIKNPCFCRRLRKMVCSRSQGKLERRIKMASEQVRYFMDFCGIYAFRSSNIIRLLIKL